jgi:hypothetical protein
LVTITPQHRRPYDSSVRRRPGRHPKNTTLGATISSITTFAMMKYGSVGAIIADSA